MSATASSPVPSSLKPHPWSVSVGVALVIICLSAIAVWAVYTLPILSTVAVLAVVICAVFCRSLGLPTPRRLVPLGLAGSLAVRLRGSSLMVGRLPCCRVEIPLPTVSSHHCRLTRRGADWFIEDLDSRNGTFVNGKRVRRKRLHIGDTITIGEFEFRVE